MRLKYSVALLSLSLLLAGCSKPKQESKMRAAVPTPQVTVMCPSLPCSVLVTGPVVVPPPPPPSVTVLPATLVLSAALNTDSPILFVTLTNPNSAAVVETDSMTGAGFNYGGIGTCKQAVPGNGSCTISVKYHPTSSAGSLGSLTVSLGSPSVNTVVNLTGSTTVAPPVLHSSATSWSASPSTTTVGYNLYRSTTSGGPYTKLNTALITGLSYKDTTVVTKTTYYYVATAVDATGTESISSNQVTAVIP